MITDLIFDFDGTIVDTSNGVINSMQYTIKKLGMEEIPNSIIKETIGPPLEIMFEILLNTRNRAIINQAVFYFRDRYARRGLKESELYKNVKSTLTYLHNSKINMYIATCKPFEFTKIITENLGIMGYFRDISGTELSGNSKSKSDRIKEIIIKHHLDTTKTLMVGDRKEDVIAAKSNELSTIGVLYGFGSKEELVSAGSKYLCNQFDELKNIVISN